MSFFQQVGIGFRSYSTALSFVFNKGLWIYIVYPLIVAVLLFIGGFALIQAVSDDLRDWIMTVINPEGEQSEFFSFLNTFLYWFVLIALKILFFFIFSSLTKFIVLILLSPMMAVLSERTEEILTGKKYPFVLSVFMKNVFRGVMIALRNFFIQILIIGTCFLVSWIPVIGWLSPFVMLLFSYYFYGFSMVDYVNERRNLGVSQSVMYIRSNKTMSVANGFVFSVIFAIPFIGTVFAPILAPIAATIAVFETEKLSK